MIFGIVIVFIGFFLVLHVLGLAVWALFTTLLVGLVFGGLGRLVVPGRQRMGLGTTALVGVGGSIVGGLIGRAAGLAAGYTFLIEVALTAVLVALYSRRGRRGRVGPGLGRPRRRAAL